MICLHLKYCTNTQKKQAHSKTNFVIRWLRLFHFLCVLGLQLERLLTLSVYASSAFKSYPKDTIFHIFYILLLFYTKRKLPIACFKVLQLLFQCNFFFLVLLCLDCSISSLFLVAIVSFHNHNVV